MTEIHRVTGRSVWLGADMAKSEEWLYRFTPDALAEIDECVRRWRQSGKPLDDVGVADFPFAALGVHLKDFKDELATGRGFVILRGIPADRYTDDELGLIFWGFGAHFGMQLPQSFLGDRLGTIMNLEDEEPERTRRRGYHSGGAQTMHTDSTDIVGMISIRKAKVGGESRLASAHFVNNMLYDLCPKVLEQLYEGFVCRTTDTDAEAFGITPLVPFRVPAFRFQDGWLNTRFVRGYMKRAVVAGDHAWTHAELLAADAFDSIANHPDTTFEHVLEPGDIQMFNNRTVLHGRAHFEDYPEKARRRHLKRLWLSVSDWPKVPQVQVCLPVAWA